MAGHLVTDVNTGALPVFLPFIKESLSLSYTMTASIILIFNVTSSVIQPVFGYFSDRWSTRWLLPAGPFVASLGLGLLGFAPSYLWIALLISLSGIGQASYHPEGFKTMHFLAGTKKASANSLFIVAGNFGLAIGPFLATLFYKYHGLKGALWFCLPGVVIMVVFLLTSHWEPKDTLPFTQAKPPNHPGSFRKNLFPITLLLLVVMFRTVARLGLLTFIPFYVINVLHKDPLITGQYLSAFLLAGTLGSLAGGPLADRYGYKKTVLTSLSVAPIFLYLFLYTGGIWSLIIFAFSGLILVSSHAVTMAMGQSFMPDKLGMASALMLGFSMGIGGIGTTILGWVADHWGLLLTLHIIFIMPFLAFLACLLIPYPPSHLEAS